MTARCDQCQFWDRENTGTYLGNKEALCLYMATVPLPFWLAGKDWNERNHQIRREWEGGRCQAFKAFVASDPVRAFAVPDQSVGR